VPQDRLKAWEFVRYGNAPSPVAFSQSVMVFRRKRPTDRPVAQPTDSAPLAASRPVDRR
jgi:hypothetical protein